MDRMKLFNGFQFDDNLILDNQIQSIGIYFLPQIVDIDWFFSFHSEPSPN